MIPLDSKERTEVFENVCKAVAKKIFAPGFDAAAWTSMAEARREQILEADTVGEFEREVRELLTQLKISHIRFFHRSLLKIPPPYAIGATFQREQVNGAAHWMSQDVHEGSSPEQVGIQPGDLLLEIEGNPVAPPEQPAFRMGGGAGGLRLMSYMMPAKIPVGYSVTQKRAAEGFKKEKLPRFGKIPSRKTGLFPLLLRHAFSDRSIVMVTEGFGPQPFHGRIVLLVNQHAASAAETIAGFAQENKLATIVGTTTPGQVPGGTGLKMGNGFVLRLPMVTFHTWSGNTLEGKRVRREYIVELSRGGLEDGRDVQWEKAIAIARGF